MKKSGWRYRDNLTGLRPGEKLYEELLIGDKVSKTPHKQILRVEEDFIRRQELALLLPRRPKRKTMFMN